MRSPRYEAWITGRKRFQGGKRAALEFFEAEDDLRIKINPLAHWGRADLQDYIINNRLPRHPLVAKGYPSIGCAALHHPCRPGRRPARGPLARQAKDECGIHFINGRAVAIRN